MPTPRWLTPLPWRTRSQISDDFEEELCFHYEMRVTELIRAGIARGDAEQRAVKEFGDINDARRYVASVDGAAEAKTRRRDMLTEFLQDVPLVARRLRRSPAYTATAVGSLALGVAACALIANVIASVILAPLPFKAPARAVMIWASIPQVDLGFPESPLSGRYVTDLRANLRSFSALSAFRPGPFNLTVGDSPLRIDGIEATGDFFDAIGVAPQLGRFFRSDDEAEPHGAVVVLSDALWRERFQADRAIVGRVISLNAEPYTVIGIAPSGFSFPRGAEMPGNFQFPARADLWVPISAPKRGPSDLAVIARLKDGVSIATARADLDHAREIEERLLPQGKGWFGTMAVPLEAQLVGQSEPMLLRLLAAVGLLLLLACANTAQLQLAQLQARRRELAVRAALGASSGRLAREVAIELILLVTAAGIVGGVVAQLGWSIVRAYGASRLPRLADVGFDWRAVAVATIAAGIAGLMASLIAGRTVGKVPLVETLRSGGRGLAGGSLRSRRVLIGAELALCVALVASAGLLLRSLDHQLSAATGFVAPNGLTFEVTLAATKYPERQGATFMEHPAALAFFARALEQLRAVPGVRAVAIGKPLPLSGAQEASVFVKEFAAPRGANDPPSIAQYTVASSQMFDALGTHVVAGRDFTEDDRLDALPVVIINKSMAGWLWPGASVLGKRIKLGGSLASPAPWMTVVGVVDDIKRFKLTETPRPEMVVPYAQNPYPTFLTMQFVVRSSLPSATLLPNLRKALASVDPTVPVSSVRTINDLIGETSAPARFATRFMTAFGVAALILAMVGVYGLSAFGVHQRRQEFGVRRALGASPAEVLGLVVRDACTLAAYGTAVGLALAMSAGFALRSLLYQVPAIDPLTLVGTTAVLAGATVLAALLPGWRASRIEARAALEET
ncbi:MAG TPA: ABC transporter permease [Gemmatimonadaceae bacterium]|jgi:predicted permease